MYTVTANGTVLFSSSDVRLVQQVFKLYRELYAWASVRVMKKAS
jgi:hypothetical protein